MRRAGHKPGSCQSLRIGQKGITTMSTLTPSPFDERTWARVLHGFETIGSLIRNWTPTRPDAPELAADLFYACRQMEPRVRDNASGIVADTLRYLLAHRDWPATRELIGDDAMFSVTAGFYLLFYCLRAGTDVEAGVDTGLREIRGQIERIAEMERLFAGKRAPLTIEQRMHMADSAKRNPKLARIAQIAGRLKRVAAQVHMARVEDKRDDVYDVELGDALPQVLPSELALLAGSASPAFLHKYSEKRLMQWQVGGDEPQGQGPIVVAIDSSGSMAAPSGVDGFTREEWAKAMILGLKDIADAEKRDLAVIHFGNGSHQIKVFHFVAGRNSADAMVDCLEVFFGGGTTYEAWMREALKLIDQSRYNKADVIVLSDGGAYVSESAQAEWNRRRQQRGMRCCGVMIGAEDFGGLAFVADSIMRLSGDDEDTITSAVFAI